MINLQFFVYSNPQSYFRCSMRKPQFPFDVILLEYELSSSISLLKLFIHICRIMFYIQQYISPWSTKQYHVKVDHIISYMTQTRVV